MAATTTVLNVVCLAGVVIYLWRYFGFVGFDLSKFKPAPPASRVQYSFRGWISSSWAYVFISRTAQKKLW